MRTDFFWDHIVPITRIWGLITSIILLGVGVDLCFFHQLAGGFTIVASIVSFVLETVWATTVFLLLCFRDENHPCFSCWDGVLWLDTWKKTVIYWCFAVLLFAQPHRIWFSTSAGFCLVFLGMLHGCLFYQEIQRNSQVCLLEQQDDADRFDQVVVVEDADRSDHARGAIAEGNRTRNGDRSESVSRPPPVTST